MILLGGPTTQEASRTGFSRGTGRCTGSTVPGNKGSWSRYAREIFYNPEYVISRYTGEIRDSLFHGMGEYTWPNGDFYVGQYNRGRRNGIGDMIYADGDTYRGKFRDGERERECVKDTEGDGPWIRFREVSRSGRVPVEGGQHLRGRLAGRSCPRARRVHVRLGTQIGREVPGRLWEWAQARLRDVLLSRWEILRRKLQSEK